MQTIEDLIITRTDIVSGRLMTYCQIGRAAISCKFEYEPGQRAILDRAPEDCQPGYEPTATLTEAKADEPIFFSEEDGEGIALTLPAGTCIWKDLSSEQREALEIDEMESMATAEPY